MVNRTLAVLRVAFAWGKNRGHSKGENPVAGVHRLRRPHDAKQVNRPWLPDEAETVLAAARPKLRLALTIAAYTGLRQSDVVTVPWSAYDGRRFLTRTQKTGQRVWIPAHSRLRALLDAMPRETETIVPPLRTGAFRRMFYDLTAKLRAEGKIGEGLSIHGLRHTLGHQLAEAGCDPPTIAAILGHSNSRMAEHYSRTANRDHLAAAAFAKLESGKPIYENGKPSHKGQAKLSS